jgi:hypothetical protein
MFPFSAEEISVQEATAPRVRAARPVHTPGAIAALHLGGRRDGGGASGRREGHVRPSGSFNEDAKIINLSMTETYKK